MLRVHQLLEQHSSGVQINPWDLWTGLKMLINFLLQEASIPAGSRGQYLNDITVCSRKTKENRDRRYKQMSKQISSDIFPSFYGKQCQDHPIIQRHRG